MKKIKGNYNLIDVDVKIGLTKEEVLKRQELGQTNKISKGSSKTLFSIIFSNVFTFFNLVIFTLVFLLIYVEAYLDILFSTIVILNVIIGITQEVRAKKTLDKLSLLASFNSRVLRDGKKVEIKVEEIVLNDILILNSGNQIPADAVVKEGHIEVDESLLTGESNFIIKEKGDFLYSGSYLVNGSCLAEVVNVGENSYIERLSGKAKRYLKPNSRLMNSLRYIIRILTVIIVPIGFILFNYHYSILSMDLQMAIRKTAGALVGMIPSGLFLLTSTALMVGVIRLAHHNTLVQELYCIEMLARVDTLCLDKTGTITDGTMEVLSIISLEDNKKLAPEVNIPKMLSAFKDKNFTTEALIEKFGYAEKAPKINNVIEFSAVNRYSAVELKGLGTLLLGSPDTVLVKTEYNKIKAKVNKYASQGLRVLVYAHSPNEIINGKIPTLIKPISLILLEDTIRYDAKTTIDYFKAQGVELKIISGDHPLTVSNIAKRAGVDGAENYVSLEGFTNSEVTNAATKYRVFGRANPEQKEILIKALKAQGKTVAMVGDGVNDILALKEADASIAMASGSEATRNVSHLVMLDSSFSSMPKVVNEGRRVLNNIQKVASLFLTKTIFSIFLTIVVMFIGKEYIYTTRQLLLINVAVIGIPSLIVSLQPNFDIVKGNFLSNVLKSAIPGALAITSQITLILLVFASRLSLTELETTTIIVIGSTFTAIMILYNHLKPLNGLRGVLFVLVVIFSGMTLLFIPGFFEINALIPYYISLDGAPIARASFDTVIVLLVMIFSSKMFISFFAKTPKDIDRGVRWFFKRLSGV